MKLPYHFARTRVKICGLTRAEDALFAALAGADAIGLVFYPPSPRHVDSATAQQIIDALPPFVSVVGLFVDADPRQVHDILNTVPIDLLQFHGNEAPDYCRSFGRPYIKAVAMRDNVDLERIAHDHAAASGLLLDAYQPGTKGGTGTCFDWTRVGPHCSRPIILAGGLECGNVRRALETVRPYAVDVSSGVESARGVKDSAKMKAFLKEVQTFDSARTNGG